jgi:hypothetical protein
VLGVVVAVASFETAAQTTYPHLHHLHKYWGLEVAVVVVQKERQSATLEVDIAEEASSFQAVPSSHHHHSSEALLLVAAVAAVAESWRIAAQSSFLLLLLLP